VAERAELLADQYRKKAQLYGFNTILVPLGDDFRFIQIYLLNSCSCCLCRYDLSAEWTDQHSNYKKLFEYMNARDDWNINARFGTLDDYFAMLERRLEDGQEAAKREGKLRHSIVRQSDGGLPVLSGDFFTYADRDDHYWSGYFTSRPFYKHMDRSLQHFLRAADIFYTLANWKGKSG
jgi:alpha-mannosidase II